MAPPPIPLLRVRGLHREVGEQVGAAVAEVLRRATDPVAWRLPVGRSAEAQLALAALYREATRQAVPWLVEEIDGAAAGASVDPRALFAASIEEIWAVRPSQASAEAIVRGRCSDIVATAPATADGHTWVAHNNDLGADSEASVVAVEWRVPGEPVVFSLGIGPWISVGWNDAGLSLTGNELTPNDERVGVPRLLMVREQLTTRTVEAAIAAALRPDRASSYNTVFAHRDGGVANVEGAATDAEVTRPDAAGTLAHTNHYVCQRMLRYEGDPDYARRSAVRYRRAAELIGGAAATAGAVTPERLRAILSDHAGAPDSICRHLPAEGDGAAGASTTKTVFWCLADVTAGRILYGRGNPCDSEAQEYAFT